MQGPRVFGDIWPLRPVHKVQVLAWVGLSVVLFCSILWFPVIGVFAGALTPLPTSLAVYQWGLPGGFVVPVGTLLVGALLLSFAGLFVTYPYLFIFMFMGFLLGIYGRMRKELNFTVVVPALTAFFLGSLLFLWHYYATGESVWNRLEDKIFKMVLAIFETSFSGGDTSKILVTPYMMEQVKNTIHLVVRLMPGVSFASLLFVSTINALALRRYAEKNKLVVPPWPSITDWRSPEWIVWLVIAAGFSALFPYTRITGLNLLIAFGIIYLLQGLSIFLYFAGKWKFPVWLKVAAVVLILGQQYLALLLAFLGFFDVWLDIRKLSNIKNENMKE